MKEFIQWQEAWCHIRINTSLQLKTFKTALLDSKVCDFIQILKQETDFRYPAIQSSHFTNAETEAQSGLKTCRSHTAPVNGNEDLLIDAIPSVT